MDVTAAPKMTLQAELVSVSIGGNDLVKDASLQVESGQLAVIVGPNGAGKSTLVKCLAGLQKPTKGEVSWNGRSIATIRGKNLAHTRAFIPQRATVPDGLTAGDAVMIGRAAHIGSFSRATSKDRQIAAAALRMVSASHLSNRYLPSLSGGEMQRVQMAVALAQAAPAIIADEPTSALDLGITTRTAQTLRKLADSGLLILVVIHDLALAAAIADVVYVMDRGRIVASGSPSSTITPELIRAVWDVEASIEFLDKHTTSLAVSWI